VCRQRPSVRRSKRHTSLPDAAHDIAPLTLRQITALLGSAARELTWALPAVAREVRHWHQTAEAIPEAPLRDDALDSLARKRGQTDGAALFTILPRAANRDLLRAVVSYQILWDFLDTVSERHPVEQNSQQLNQALIDALEPAGPLHDYYRHHPWHEDGGYLQALIATCRAACCKLPGYPLVQALILREANRAEVLALNHQLDPHRRVTTLQGWTSTEFPHGHEAAWFELSGAASASLTIFALLALAAEPWCSDADVALTADAYFPWPGALATMLDSYVDEEEDITNGAHVYISYYENETTVVKRTGELLQRSLHSVSRLPSAHKHTVIIASMAAMYLSKDSARSPHREQATTAITAAGGSLTIALLPVLRLWRGIYRLRTT